MTPTLVETLGVESSRQLPRSIHFRVSEIWEKDLGGCGGRYGDHARRGLLYRPRFRHLIGQLVLLQGES